MLTMPFRNALLPTQTKPEPVFLEAPSRRFVDAGRYQREAHPFSTVR